MGFTDCLDILLNQPSLDYTILTREYKLVLGQNIPQYEAGGRSALILAIEALQPDAVRSLLSHNEARVYFLSTKDSFGRTPLEVAGEVLSLREKGSVARTLAEDTCKLLYAAEFNEELDNNGLIQMDIGQTQARERLRQRNIALRSRLLSTSHIRKKLAKEEGFLNWQKNYKELTAQLLWLGPPKYGQIFI